MQWKTNLQTMTGKGLKTHLKFGESQQTIPDEAPPIGKIDRFSKMAITLLNHRWDFDALRDLESS